MGRGHHHHGGGFRAPRGGGGYFAPPAYYSSWYDAPSYVPIFVMDDDEEEKKRRIAAEVARQLAEKKAKATHGLGIFGSALGVIFGNTTSDPKVVETQKWLNGYLTKLGFTTLTVDGKLGAKTCGACAWAFGNTPDVDISTAPGSFFEVWQVCSSSSQTMPTPLTQAAKTSAYTTGVQAMQVIPNTEAVQQTQAALNLALKAAGMCAITMDGKAGPETCGAQKWLIANAGGDGLTQEQRNSIYPTCSVVNTIAPSACPAPAVATQAPAAIVPVIAPVPTTAPPAPKISKAGMVMGLGIAAAVAGVAYYYFQHRTA